MQEVFRRLAGRLLVSCRRPGTGGGVNSATPRQRHLSEGINVGFRYGHPTMVWLTPDAVRGGDQLNNAKHLQSTDHRLYGVTTEPHVVGSSSNFSFIS